MSLGTDELQHIVDQTQDNAVLAEVLKELTLRKSKAAAKLRFEIERKLGLSDQVEMFAEMDEAAADPKEDRERRRAAPQDEFTPTPEQEAAVQAFLTGNGLKVSAFAGAGKTSTLKLMSSARAGRGIYLAFNAAIAREARQKFPRYVNCRTTHSLAFRHVQGSKKYNHSKLFTQLRVRQLAAMLDLSTRSFDGGIQLTDTQQAHLLLGAIRAFCMSDSQAVIPAHVPLTARLRAMSQSARDNLRSWAATEAASLWQRMQQPDDVLPLGHDGYLKLWSLSQPKLAADFILLDEAQDTNNAVLSVLTRQSAQVVYVGDRHQQIYEWRGAINAMEKVPDCIESPLTQSFRFGPVIAEAASRILRALGEHRPIVGNPDVESVINTDQNTRAVLARTNTTVISETLQALGNNKLPYIVGGTAELKKMVGDVFNLRKGEPPRHPDFFGFTNWDEVEEFAETDEGEELRPFVTLVQIYGEGRLWYVLKETTEAEDEADICISTGHKAKGREWDSVRIASDFGTSRPEDEPISPDEARLFYVAITRAKQVLSIEPALLDAFASAKVSDSAKKRGED